MKCCHVMCDKGAPVEVTAMDQIIVEITTRFKSEGQPVPRCGSYECCHYGEGCALGYPVVSELNGFGLGWKALIGIWRKPLHSCVVRLYSAEFRTHWEARLGTSTACGVLPCCHEGCSFSECQHLRPSKPCPHHKP